ncbi:MAG TPA: globin [Kribbellaceae bacterium]|nr:globin [Kribbellaceae bacterium]
MSEAQTFYDAVGGAETFRKLIGGFYRRVPDDPILGSMYPHDELAEAEERLRMFLEQYWGGPRTYSDQRGHPRLRMRHMPFAVTPSARDRWLELMRAALDEVALEPDRDQEIWTYLVMAAHSMVNTDEPEQTGALPMTEES